MIYLLREPDYAIARRLMQEAFQAGAQVVWVGQDAGAMNLLTRHHFDLAILSICERDLEPEGLLSQLKGKLSKVPVVLLAERGVLISENMIDGLDVVDRLRKPFAPWAFCKHLRPIFLDPPKRQFGK